MNTDEFLDNYKNSLDDYVQGYGHKEGIKRFVKHFSNDELVQNIKEQEDDDLGGALAGLTEKEYIPIRNKVFDTKFNKLIKVVKKIEGIFKSDTLDIEFAIKKNK